jgi:putative tryptophan/tyrosine transport system substrate-binding protein
MRRREFIALLSIMALAFPITAEGQGARLARIGFLGNSTAALEANLVEPFRAGLRELGYEEGRNLIIEYRWAEADYSRFPALVADLIAANVEVIVTAGTPAALAVKRATATIPCVMVAVGDPVGTGLVQSLAKPGGNLTGLTSIAPELEGKRLELLREVDPHLSHIAVLWNPDSPFSVLSEKEVQAAASTLRMKVLSLGVRTSEELDRAFGSIEQKKPGALVVVADRVFLHNRSQIADFSSRERLPGVYAYRELVEAGGLMSYGPSYEHMHRQAASYVDKLLKGAKAADLPVERPAKFELVVNIKTARALGITVPLTLQAQANEVIE